MSKGSPVCPVYGSIAWSPALCNTHQSFQPHPSLFPRAGYQRVGGLALRWRGEFGSFRKKSFWSPPENHIYSFRPTITHLWVLHRHPTALRSPFFALPQTPGPGQVGTYTAGVEDGQRQQQQRNADDQQQVPRSKKALQQTHGGPISSPRPWTRSARSAFGPHYARHLSRKTS